MAEVKTTKTKETKQKKWTLNENFKWSCLAVSSSIIIGIIIMIWAGQVHQIDDYFWNLLKLNFFTSAGFANFLGNLGWMVVIGLSLGVAFKAGQFNIGAAGQMIAGGITSFLFASNVHMGNGGFIFTILIATITGAFVAWVIGVLKTQFNINVVISSIMINWMIFYLMKYVGGLKIVLTNYSTLLSNSLRMDWLSSIFHVSPLVSAINIGFIIAIILVVVFTFIYKKTAWGYKQEILGKNPRVANYIGVNKNREIIKTLVISGALAGFAGAIYYCGILDTFPKIETLNNIPEQGFEGITIALIGFSSPVGIFAASILIAIINANGADGVIGSMSISGIMIALMIIFLSIVQYFVIYNPLKAKNKNDNQEKKPIIKKIKKKPKETKDKGVKNE